jgi:SAM-dependent methyltransferase
LRDRLTEDAAAGREIAPHSIVAIASCEPLHSVPGVESLLDKPWPAPLAALLTQQVREPLEEQRLRQSIPGLTAIADDVSLKVKQQYEENPYPRWIKPAPVQPKSLAEYFGSGIPVPAPGPRGAVEILIAGCGTGQNLVEMAREIADAEVTAIDLSLASLAYAKRQATALGLHNVTFATADILNLGSVGRTFDLIDASGVLHHLADPWAAWRMLLKVLRPGGLMRVGLYSKPGRAVVNAARAFVAERGFPATVEGIRRSRQAILALDEQSPVRPVANYPDFFATSECRDMLFHVQEHQMTLPEINRFVGEHDLEFVGFQVEPHVLQKFATQHADPAALTDLGLWHKFETENPAAFAGMYQFWIRRK